MGHYTQIPLFKALLDAGTASITSAWKSLVSSASAASYASEIFNSTGELMELGYGASSTSVTPLNYFIIPGGPDGRVGIRVDEGQNLFVRMVGDVTASTGILAVNFLR